MLHELLAIFRSGNPLQAMAENFAAMLQLASEMTATAGRIFFQEPVPPEERRRLKERDLQVNELESTIRKQVIVHLAAQSNTADLQYCLLLMSLVKDVERMGDYAKNLGEVVDLYSGDLPDDRVVGELREIRANVESMFQQCDEVFSNSDRERALQLIQKGKQTARSSDELVAAIARQDYGAGMATVLALGTRYYKRIGGHVLNVLSGVVMPVHKIDYFDEDDLPDEGSDSGG